MGKNPRTRLVLILLILIALPISYAGSNEGVPTTIGIDSVNIHSYWTYDLNTTSDIGAYSQSYSSVTQQANCLLSGCLYFDGGNDYVNYTASALPANKPMTITFWGKTYDTTTAGYWWADTSTATAYSLSRVTTVESASHNNFWDGANIGTGTSDWTKTNPVLKRNLTSLGMNVTNWVMYTLTMNSSGAITTYLNATNQVGPTINQSTYAGATQQLMLGNRLAMDRDLKGYIDEFATFDTNLSAAQVLQLYNDYLLGIRPYTNVSTPTALTNPSLTNTSIYVTWTNTPEAAFNHVAVYYNSTATLVFVSNETGTSKNITGLAPNTTYTIQLYTVADNDKNTTTSAYITNNTATNPIITTGIYYSLNSTNSTLAGSSIKHSLYWNSASGLDSYIFSLCNGTWNGSDCQITGTTSWANSSYDKCKTINISYSGATTLTNFPTYVNLSYDSDMSSSYSDLIFYNNSCNSPATKIQHELENYTTTSAHIWVNIPSLNPGTTQISVYYKNNTAVPEQSSGTTVFNSTYGGVYHQNTNLSIDSTGNNAAATATGAITVNSTGLIGNSLTYADTLGLGNTLGLGPSIDLSNGTDVTVELWVKAANTANYMFFVQSQGSCSYNFLLTTYTAIIANNDIKLCWRDQSGTTRYCVDSGVTLSNQWQYVVGTYTVGLVNNSNIYINGILKANNSAVKKLRVGPVTTSLLGNGCDYGTFYGSMDEVRISKNVAISPDWVNQSYLQVVNQSSLILVSAEQSYSLSGGWVNDTPVSMTGLANWSNVTKTVGSIVGSWNAWCIYANDTNGVWNNTGCQTPFNYNLTQQQTPAITYNATINWTFDQGRLKSYNCTQTTCNIEIQPDNGAAATNQQYLWMYFNITNVKDQNITFNITNLNATQGSTFWNSSNPQIVYSCNDTNETSWQRITAKSYTAPYYTFMINFTCNSSSIATYYPYQYWRSQQMLSQINNTGLVKQTTLTTTANGQSLTLLQITNQNASNTTKKVIYIIAAQHPAETYGAWSADGLIRWLTSTNETAQIIQNTTIVYIIPLVNPEGTYNGSTRTNNGKDYNRAWDDTDTTEITNITNHINSINNSIGIDLFLDLHGDNGASTTDYIAPWPNSSAPYPTYYTNLMNFYYNLTNYTSIKAKTESVVVGAASWYNANKTTNGKQGLSMAIEGKMSQTTWNTTTAQNEGIAYLIAIKNYYNLQYELMPPNQTAPTITPIIAYTNTNLTCNLNNVYDPYGYAVQNITIWYKNNQSIINLYLPFESQKNSTWTKDYSGYAQPVTMMANVTWLQNGGITGAAYNFTGKGTASYIQIADTPILEVNNSGFTVMQWLRPWTDYIDLGTEWGFYSLYKPIQTILIGWSGWSNDAIECNIWNNSLTAQRIQALKKRPLPKNEWLHVACTYDRINLSLYINGTLQATTYAPDINITDTQYGFFIGSKDQTQTNYTFNGTIDETKIYNYSLTPSEIYQNYQNDIASKPNQVITERYNITNQIKCQTTPDNGVAEGNTLNSTAVTIQANNPPIVTLNYPLNITVQTNHTIFNCTASDDTSLNSIRFFLNGTLNRTNNTPTNNTPWIINLTLPNGNYTWNCEANDSTGNLANGSQAWVNINYTPELPPDTTKPVITLNYPINITIQTNHTIFNCTASDNIELSAIILYIDGSYNRTNNAPTNNTPWITNLTLPNGNYTWNCEANDSSNNKQNGSQAWVNINYTTPPDTTIPVWNSLANNASYVTNTNGSVNFSITLTDNINGSYYVLEVNDTGAWANLTFTAWTTPANLNVTLDNVLAGYKQSVCGMFWFNDSSNNVNVSGLSCFVVNDTVNPSYSNFVNNASDSPKTGDVINWSIDMFDAGGLDIYIFYQNATGSWVPSGSGISGTNYSVWKQATITVPDGSYVCGYFGIVDISGNAIVTADSCFMMQRYVPDYSNYSICGNPQDNTLLPCVVPFVYNDTCVNATVSLYNSSVLNNSFFVLNMSSGLYTEPFSCAALFNVSREGDYYVNGSNSLLYNVSLEVNKTMLAAIIFIPIIFGLLFIVGSVSLGKDHPALRVGLYLLSFMSVISASHLAAMMVAKYYDFPELQQTLADNVWIYGLMVGVIISYFLIYFIAIAVRTAAQDKKAKFEY
jgi:hypothetical protein